MIEIVPRNINRSVIIVPGSKSYTHRIYIAAALSNGLCKINNWLDSEDTNHTLKALRQLGIKYEKKDDGLYISGTNGALEPYNGQIDVGNSGTSMRLLTALTGIGKGIYILTGTERMQQRPIQNLLDALNQVGISAVSVNNNGCPPVKVIAGEVKGKLVHVNCGTSSQYLSALLLIAPLAKKETHIRVTEGPVSKPYIDMTLDVMTKFGVKVERDGYTDFFISGTQHYLCGNYDVEPDSSQASYFWAAAAITGSEVKVKGITKDSKQGDIKFVDVLQSMGCKIIHAPDGISVLGGRLSAINVDMVDMPDLVPTLAVVASFANGTTLIKSVAHLKAKESDRLSAVINELSKMGIVAASDGNDLTIAGGRAHGAEIDTYNDHRIAMSFAVAGLSISGIKIKNEMCVEKSFPQFWHVFNKL